MPRLRPYNIQTQARGQISGGRTSRSTGADFGAQTGQALAQTGDRIVRAAGQQYDDYVRREEVLEKRQEQSEIARVQADLAKAQTAWGLNLQERLDNANPEDPEVAPQYVDDFNVYLEGLEESVQTDGAKRYLRTQGARMLSHYTEKAFVGQAAVRGTHAKLQYDEALQARGNSVLNDPSTYQMTVEQNHTAIDALPIPEIEKSKLKQASGTYLASVAMSGMVNRDPYAVKEIMQARMGTGQVSSEVKREYADEINISKEVDPEKVQSIINSADAAINKIEAEEARVRREQRQVLQSRVEDQAAMARDGVVPTADSVITRSEFYSAFEDSGDADKAYSNYQQTLELGQNIHNMQGLSHAEIRTLVQSQTPQAGEGYAADSQRYKVLQQAAAQTLKTREESPAEYVLKYSDNASDAFDRFANSEGDEAVSAAQDYANIMKAEQDRLGIVNKKVLPQAYVNSVVQKYTDQDEGGFDSAALVKDMADTWGKNWPEVYGQMANDIPSSARVIGAVDMAPTAAAELTKASNIPMDDLTRGLPSMDVTTIKDTVGTQMEDLRKTLAGMPGGDNTYGDFHESVLRLALAYRRKGSSNSDAVERAYTETVSDHFEFQGRNEVTYMVPKQYDSDAVAWGAERMLKEQLPIMEDVVIPDPALAMAPGAAREDAIKSIQEFGYFRPAPGNKGLNLYVNGSVVTRRTPSGELEPITFGYQDLQTQAFEAIDYTPRPETRESNLFGDMPSGTPRSFYSGGGDSSPAPDITPGAL